MNDDGVISFKSFVLYSLYWFLSVG